jgi:site-specific DNA recombinase
MTKPKRLLATRSEEAHADPEPVGVEPERKRAVIYLRVSTPSQVKTDYNPEGISLPAQRDACELKAAALETDIVQEFVEPGRSATSIDKRPVFQEMLAWIKGQKNIDFVICYQFSRMFRDSVDAGITKRDLAKFGTRVVSTAMDLGEGPESAMVESILHAVDEYRSKADGADIAYKMGAKARNGGTLGRAPLGYTNARDLSEGRNIGIVKFDEERAPLVRTAFELFATGDYSIDTLVEELTGRGLRTRPGRFAAGPISASKLAVLLRDPYYVGFVTYKGELISGRHDRLITDELFDRVQTILDERGMRGTRQRRHYHYLKGILWCGQCHDEGVESRMIMQWANGHGGRYLYFFCRRKQQHRCGARYIAAEAIESAVVDYYATIRFPGEQAARIRKLMHETLEEVERSHKLRHEQLTAELLRLDRQEENLLDLVADGEESSVKVKERLGVIKRRRSALTAQLDETGERLAFGAQLLEDALALLEDAQGMYERMGPEQRRLMNQALFEKLYIDESVADALFNPPFDELLEVRDAMVAVPTPATVHRSGSLADIVLGQGSNKGVMVGAEGLEPPTCWL